MRGKSLPTSTIYVYPDSIGPRECSSHVGIGEDSFSPRETSMGVSRSLWMSTFGRVCKHTFVREICSLAEPIPQDLLLQGVRPSFFFHFYRLDLFFTVSQTVALLRLYAPRLELLAVNK